MTAMLDAALKLAAAGWRVFPCDWRPGQHSKAPMISNGFHGATCDPDVIQNWWRRSPRAMIGATVRPTWVVLDIDPRHGGNRDALEPLPPTLTAWSGRGDGGHHLYFQRPLGPLTSTRLVKLGVDLRIGGKSYCIVPPSVHPDSGKPYWWEPHEPAVLPLHIQELITPPPQRKRALSQSSDNGAAGDALVRHVARAPKGNRDRALFWAACRAAEDGILDSIQDQLVAASVSIGLPEAQAWRKIASARKTTA
jgi:hypothetical protein